MKTANVRPTAISVALVTCLSFGAGEVEGLVVCFTPGGHIEIEPSGHACCSGPCGSFDAAAPARTAPEHRHCVDIPLAGQKSVRPAASAGKFPPAGRPELVVARIHGASWDASQQSISAGRAPPPHPTRTLLRTVILLV